ncbi:MAG: arsenate reductase ArsC [Thaumarchaeota archaeon]|nr:arsenate reductase ArsC [Nitrososphaerota archaeon]
MGVCGERIVLFVCVENAARSQMAEGFFRKYAPKEWQPISAGTRPGMLDQNAVRAMNEVGVDISGQKPKELSGEMIRSSALRVGMGCIESAQCPAVFLGDFQDWGIEDPKGKPIEKVREIRDKIEERVRELVRGLESR